MGRAERLKLLFGDEDGSLLQTNTRLKVPVPVPVPTVSVVEVPETQPDDAAAKEISHKASVHEQQIKDETSQKAPVEEAEAPKTIVHSEDQNQEAPKDESEDQSVAIVEDPPMPQETEVCVSSSFCPLIALSRFPYRFIHGDPSQPVASAFFDGGKFWKRRWNIYYIHVPLHISPQPLLLVPVSQVEKLLKDINRKCETTCSLPSSDGFVLNFQEDGTPQPIFLGQSTSREMKDYLESRIKTVPNSMFENDAIPEYQAYEQKIEAAVKLTKNKKGASKAKKQLVRIQTEHKWIRCLKRTQTYFGLRRDPSNNQDPDPSNQQESSQQPNEGVAEGEEPAWKSVQLAPSFDEPAPYVFLNEPVFISVDVECNERCHSQITEVGLSILDTRDLAGTAPGQEAANWISRIKSRHLRVVEYGHIINHDFVPGCPDRFEFGESEWVKLEDMPSVVDNCFRSYLPETAGGEDAQAERRNVVLVGHNPSADVNFFLDLGVPLFRESKEKGVFLDTVDTAELFRVSRQEMNVRSLGSILATFGITGWYLHNAGNDARYTMEALVRMLFHESHFYPHDFAVGCVS